jgi:hypothetical protein
LNSPRDRRTSWRRARRSGLTGSVILAAGAAGCLPPRALPLSGSPAPTRALPTAAATVAPGHHRVRFRWRYRDPRFSASGDGAARVAYPDSARLDFIVGGPLGGSGRALLFGDTLVAPDGGGVHRYLPATPLVWATLGRLAVPAAADTIVRVDGDTVRADIGSPTVGEGTVWRVAFIGGELTGLARLNGGRVRETVERSVERGRIQYENAGARRSLTLTQVRSEEVSAFDSSVWHP